MKKKDELAKNARGCLAKAEDNEMLFILRAQDRTAPGVVIEWIRENILSAPESKLREAFECALEMRKCEFKKIPD